LAELRIFSGDSHVSEPADLWTTRLDDEFKFRAPRVEARERGGKMVDMFIYEGWPPHPVGVGLGAAARAAEATNREAFREGGRGYNDARPGGWNPVERLKDMEIDGVAGEILHTTLGFRLFWLRDMNLMRACFRVYNDWLAEYCSESPKRLVGVPLICLDDINLAIEELRRTA
jgi:predicted TIM-barrel fold metal-dependent hydrolase